MNMQMVHLALKEEQAALVRECGGLKCVEGLVGLKKSQIQRITDPNTKFFFNTLQIAALEATSGNPRVSRLLARLRGYDLEANNRPVPLLSSEVDDWAPAKMQLVATICAKARNYIKSQKSPRALSEMREAVQALYDYSGAALLSLRVIASKQRETA